VPQALQPKVSFVLSVGFGNGSPLPQPSGQWDVFVNDRAAISICTVNHTQLWRNERCSFAFSANRIEAAVPYGSLCLSSLIRDESVAAFGPAFLTVPSFWVKPGEKAMIRVEPHSDVPSTRWFQITPVRTMLQSADIYPVVALLRGDPYPRIDGYNVYFGDIHTHSGQIMDECQNKGCGWGTRVENYEYARGPGALDFYALTDHEYQIDPRKTDEYLGLADRYNDDRRFVCLPGFEHTDALHGHRNVYFRGSGGTVFNTNKEWGLPTLHPALCYTPYDLWAAMERTGVPFITVPHHASATSHPLSLGFHNPKYDRLYEVYSCWGSSEYYGDFPRGVSDRFRVGQHLRDALRRGQRYGIIASSDGHDGHPGHAQSPLVKHHHLFHFCGSGRAAVLAHALTRKDVFDALYARRCYGTTGPPIVLSVTLNGAHMGSELPSLAERECPCLSIKCRGTNGLDQVRVVKNGRPLHTISCHGENTAELDWADATYDGETPCSYYVRVVQTDGESAWSSPIWIG
jgi:hypothetical protein